MLLHHISGQRVFIKLIKRYNQEVQKMAREKITLTPAQLARLKGLDTDTEWLKEEIRRAEYVGLDVADLKERFEKMSQIRARMIEEYSK